MKYIRLNDRKNDEAVLRKKIINAYAIVDGFQSSEAAAAVHPKILEHYARFCEAAIQTIREHQNYQIEEVAEDGDKTHV